MDSTTTPSNNKQAHVPTLDDWARFNKKRAAEKTARKAARRDAKKATQTAVEQAVHGTPDGEPQEEIIDPTVLAWEAKFARQWEHEERNWRQKEEQWAKEAERAARGQQREEAATTSEDAKRSESPLNAPAALSEEEESTPPTVANECGDDGTRIAYGDDMSVENEENTSKVELHARPSKLRNERLGRSPADRQEVSADSGVLLSSPSHSHVDPLGDEGQHASPSYSHSTSEFYSNSDSSSYSGKTEFMGTQEEGLGEYMERLIAEEEAMMDTMKAEEDQEEIDPLIARIADPHLRALMVRMQAADRLPSDGLVTYPNDNACKRRRAQYVVLEEAWAILAPRDRLMRGDMSGWLNEVARTEFADTEGELILDSAIKYFSIERQREIKHPREAFWATLYNSLYGERPQRRSHEKREQ